MVRSTPDGPQLLSLLRAAQGTGISRSLLRRAIDAGELRAYRPGNRTIFVRMSDVRGWLSQHVVQPTSHSRARLYEVLEREGRS